MKKHASVGRFELGARVRPFRRGLATALVVVALGTAGAFAQQGKDGPSGQAEEKFESVDPYTKGDADALRRAGYVTFRPVLWAEGITTKDVAEVLGGADALWVETAHFKICSCLKTYKTKGDPNESARLKKELAQLALKIPSVNLPHVDKLDPWLRLHLYALRAEQLYAEFCERMGLRDADFPAVGSTNAMGNGPFLGQKLKPTLLLAEKSSALVRFNHRYAKSEEERVLRYTLPGGSMYCGVSAEALRDGGYELDLALHCAVAASLVANFLDALRDSNWATPLWLDMGLGHWFSRRIDERFTYYAAGTTHDFGDKLCKWQPRVRGLVENKFAYSWSDMLGTLEWSQLTPQAHLLIWSRVDWMLQVPSADLRAFLMPLTTPIPNAAHDEVVATQLARANAAFSAGFGKSPAECEAAWRAWVLKTYAKK